MSKVKSHEPELIRSSISGGPPNTPPQKRSNLTLPFDFASRVSMKYLAWLQPPGMSGIKVANFRLITLAVGAGAGACVAVGAGAGAVVGAGLAHAPNKGKTNSVRISKPKSIFFFSFHPPVISLYLVY